MDTNTNEITNSTVPVPLSDAEMTDGITSITRLEELLSALPKPQNSDQQNPNPSPNPNPNNPLTHYSNFARVLTATSDESLIRHFVKNLNGLGLLAEWWAHTADKHTDDVSKADVSMTLLKLLEKVPVDPDIPDSEKIVNLLSGLALNADPKIKETASVLSERWRVTKSNTGTDGTEPELIKEEESTNPNPNSVKDDETETLIPPEEREEEQEEDEEKTASDPSSPDSSSDSVPVPLRTSVPSEEKDKKTSGTAYEDDDDMDALEIARQVAIQVEEEVVNYRESLYSSPEQEDSEKDEKTEKAETAQKDKKPAAAENPPLTESKPEKNEKPATNTNNSSKDSKDSGLTSGTQNVDPVKLKESHSNKDGFEGLDLNENLCTDYDATEQGGPIHVSASKAVLSVPASPHRFETGTGTRWKGTVSTTSAFRPAGSGTLTLKRDSSFLGFDLNVAEQDDGEVVLPPSGDSSTEVSSERAKKLKLDLNRMDEDAELAVPVSVPVPIDQRLIWLQARQSGDQSQSSASSSSQKNPNLTRDFDLNDDLSEGQGQDRKFINILGSKLTVNGNNNNNSVPVKQTAAPLTFHSFLGPPSNSHSAPYQPYQPYQSQMTPHPTNLLYQHNMVPAQNWYGQPSTSYSVPIQVPSHFTRQMVGPVPVPVQENGLSVGLSLNPFGSNPFRPGLDLNSGTGTGTGLEASSSSGTGFRQFFVQSHNGTVQEPVQNSVPVPGTGLRWKDPDSDYGFRQLI